MAKYNSTQHSKCATGTKLEHFSHQMWQEINKGSTLLALLFESPAVKFKLLSS